MGKAIRESSTRTRLEKVPNCECMFVKREKGLFLSVYVDDIKNWLERNRTSSQCGKDMKDADLAEPTSFLDHVFCVALKENVEQAKNIVDNDGNMIESKNSAGGTESCLFLRNLAQTFLHGPTDMEGHAKKCVERYCELANKTTQTVIQSRNTMH